MVKQRKPMLSFCQVERCPGCARPCQAPGRKWGKLSLNILIGSSRPFSFKLVRLGLPLKLGRLVGLFSFLLLFLPIILNLPLVLKDFSSLQLEYLWPVWKSGFLKPGRLLPGIKTALASLSGAPTICIWRANNMYLAPTTCIRSAPTNVDKAPTNIFEQDIYWLCLEHWFNRRAGEGKLGKDTGRERSILL